MLTADIKTSLDTVGRITATNQGRRGVSSNDYKQGWRRYEYTYTTPSHNDDVISSHVTHFRPNGAIALIKEICEDLEGRYGR